MSAHIDPAASTGHGALIPDVQGQLLEPLNVLTDLLSDLQKWLGDRDGARPTLVLPGMLATRNTLHAVRRLSYLLRPTQSRPARSACVYGPDRAQAHTVLTSVRLPAADVGALSLTARVLGSPALPTPVRDLLTIYASIGCPDDVPADPRHLVAKLAGLAGLLDLPTPPGARRLAARLLVAQRRGIPTVLTDDEEAIYRMVLEQINQLWTASSPDHRPLQ
jgi:hypothetical protein